MDEKQIFAEVERRIQSAKSLNLPDLVFNLYFHENVRYYAAWSKSGPEYVHPDFRSAIAIPR